MNAVTPEGKALVKRFEALRLKPYLDPAGVRTVGYGHRVYPGEFKATDFPITEARADALLDRDLALKSTWVSHYVRAAVNDNQFSALVSLVFNEGVTPLCGTLGRLLNEGDYPGCADQFAEWVYARVDGKMVKMPGLVARREAEEALFLKPVDEVLPWLTKSSA